MRRAPSTSSPSPSSSRDGLDELVVEPLHGVRLEGRLRLGLGIAGEDRDDPLLEHGLGGRRRRRGSTGGRPAGGGVELAHVPRQQREVGVQAVGARAQRLDERAELALHRVDALEHERGRLVDLADMLLRALDRLVARALGVAGRVLGGLVGVLARVALDRGGAGLGRLDDRLHLRAGDGGQRRAAGGRRLRRGGRGGLGALERLDLTRDRGQVRIDGRRLVAAAADGKISLLDGLTVEGQRMPPVDFG